MNRATASRVWNAAIVVVVLVSILVQLTLVIQGKHVLTEQADTLPSVPMRIVRFLSYFTIQSNILCAVTAASLINNPDRDGPGWRIVRLNALVGITVTGIIYVTLLRPVVNLSGLPQLTDIGFHYVVPLLTVVGWLLFGPRPRIDNSTLLPSCGWPAGYMIYIVIFGATTKWYPYPFTDVVTLGYQVVIRNAIGITVLLLGISALSMFIDGALDRRVDAARVTVAVK
jgi:hypothetical protein